MLFSMIYQHPGIARNSKSKMLENEVYYNIIFKNNYSSTLFLSLQHFKVGYTKWLNKVKKINARNNKVGLAKNGFLLFLAVLGLLAKLNYNEELQDEMYETNNNTDFNSDKYRSIISRNDIGNIAIFKAPELLSEQKTIDNLLDYLYDNFVLPSYDKFKQLNPSVAFSNFTKNDTNYYRSVVPMVIKKYRTEWSDIQEELDKYFDNSQEYVLDLSELNQEFAEHKPGLSEELTEYRRIKFNQLQRKIKAYEIFTNNERTKIFNFKPRTLDDLKRDCGLTDFTIKNFGEDILKIVDKYIIK